MHWCLATIDIKRKEINYYDRSVHRKLNWSDWLAVGIFLHFILFSICIYTG